MTGAWSRLFLAAVVAALALSIPVPARAEACPPGTGITVVIDFAAFGGEVVTECAGAAPASGFDALARAGFSVTRVETNPGFLCRIDGVPADDTCRDIPPADAHWSYWTARAGGDWRLSSMGASASPAGEYEGWSFSTGQTAPPRFAVPAGAPETTSTTSTTTSTTTTTTTTTTTVAPATSSSSSTSSTTTTAAPAPPPSTSLDSTTTTTSGADGSTTTRAPLPTTTDPTEPAVAATSTSALAASPGDESVGSAGTAVTVLLVASGAVTAAVISRRRRDQ